VFVFVSGKNAKWNNDLMDFTWISFLTLLVPISPIVMHIADILFIQLKPRQDRY
jgi:hypothetical protein